MSEYRIGLLASETPPVHKGRSRIPELLAVVSDLRGQPNTWFRVGEFKSRQTASGLATKMRKKVPDVEWTSRSSEVGSFLWARYRGRP